MRKAIGYALCIFSAVYFFESLRQIWVTGGIKGTTIPVFFVGLGIFAFGLSIARYKPEEPDERQLLSRPTTISKFAVSLQERVHDFRHKRPEHKGVGRLWRKS